MKKNRITGILSVLLCIMMTISFAACGEKKDGPGSSIERADVCYSDIEFAEYDDTLINEIMDELDEAIQIENNDEKVKELCAAFLEEDQNLTDAYLFLMVDYYLNAEDEEKFEKYTYADNLSTFVGDDELVMISRVLDSPYEQIMLDTIASKNTDAYYDYEGMTDEEVPIYEAINDLQAQYNEWYSGTKVSTVDWEGEEWTWDKWETYDWNYYDENEYNKYVSIYYDLYEADGKAMGEILLQQVALRNELAKINGYDNFYDMVWTEDYMREYSFDDFMKIGAYTKQYLKTITNLFNDTRYDDYDSCWEIDGTTLYDKLLASKTLGKNAKEAIGYIKDHDLLVLAEEDDYDVAFSSKFYTVNEPMIYACRQSGTYALYFVQTLAHETGHASNFYFSHTNSLGGLYSDLDIAETQSTGFVLMYMDTIADAYKEYAEYIRRQFVGDAVGTLQNCGFQAEVEHALYTTPDLTVEMMNDMAAEIANEYGYYDAVMNGKCYFWSQIPHYSDSPGYVVSYVMSQAASLAMFSDYLDNNKTGLKNYDELVAIDTSDMTFNEMVEKFGLEKMYTESFYKDLAKKIEEFL